jgi:hypothetical protein
MAVCCATLFSTTKGKSIWGVESQQYNPILVDGRTLLPSPGAADGDRRGRAESRAYQRRAYDGKAVKGAADGHRRGRAESRASLRSLARRRHKMHGVWIFNNITPSHPSHADDTSCARPSMAAGWCLHRRRSRKQKKNSTPFPSMAVCCATEAHRGH